MISLHSIRRSTRSILRKIAHAINPPHPDQTLGNVSYAQHGEDIVLFGIFKQLGIQCPRYLDIGAHHPIHISNTALLYEHGGRGVNVEANPHLIDAFYDLRPRDITLNVAVGAAQGELDFYFIDDFSGRNTCDLEVAQDFVSKYPQFKIQRKIRVPVETVRSIYDRYFLPDEIDLLSLDVEGMDYEILSSAFNSGVFPKIVVVEIVCGGDNSQANEMRKLLEQNGYFIHVRLGANYVGVRNEFKQQLD